MKIKYPFHKNMRFIQRNIIESSCYWSYRHPIIMLIVFSFFKSTVWKLLQKVNLMSRVQMMYPGHSISQHLSHFQVTWSSGSQDCYHDLSRDQCRKIAAEHYVCITGLKAAVVSDLAEPWASKTSSPVGALSCGHLSVCGGGREERKPPDVFLNIISLCCHYRSRAAFGYRLTHNKTYFWFPIFLKITQAGTPSEHLASATNYVSIFGPCTPTQQVNTSSHGERHA